MNRKTDLRNITTGLPIPKEHYCDQPYVVVREDGAWVVCLTTGSGIEGETGQHVISSISYDKGKSWSEPVDIESAESPESSWVMPYLTQYGRIYAFYVFNNDNMRTVISNDEEGYTNRVDTLGKMAYKYSDDGGESWSEDRYYIPIRNFDIDNENPYNGNVQFFWGVGKPITHKGEMYLGFAKVGLFGEGFMEKDEGAFLKCSNINTEKNPELLVWETLPEGTKGLRAPEGKVADEHNLISLNDGSLMCTFRTVLGHNCQAYSRDDGKSWDVPEFMKDSPNGRPFKHPRAANFVRKYSNGKYTFWFHNHGKDLRHDPWSAYLSRNPAWMCAGVEKDGYIYWSQPEIFIYSEEVDDRISYPDFIEDDGEYYITETQKSIARVHKADKSTLELMWNHLENNKLCTKGLLWEEKDTCKLSGNPIPQSIITKDGDSFTIEMIVEPDKLKVGTIIDGRNKLRQGIRIGYTCDNTIKIIMNDGERESSWESDKLPCETAHITAIVDGCSGIISFVINGLFCDGGKERDFGFGRIDANLKNIAGKGFFTCEAPENSVKLVRFYNRYILTNEAVSNYRYDTKKVLAE